METQTIHFSPFAAGYIPSDLRVVNDLCIMIEKHFKEQHDPEFYSCSVHISLKRLNRLTNHYHHKTVYQLVQDRLHKEAEFLLRHTTLTAKEIALELGVCDAAHFSKCFKAVTGMTPGEFRRVHAREPVLNGF